MRAAEADAVPMRWQLMLVLPLVMALTALACAVPGIGSSAPAATPTPLGDTLSYTIPAYGISLNPGETVPGTRLHYLGRSGDTYRVGIDGLEATKRAGDSFIWNGVIAPGVYANFNLRLIMAVLGPLRVAGPVTLTVFNPLPVEQAIPADFQAALSFQNIVVNYIVPVSGVVPGTTLYYDGMITQGDIGQQSQLAKLTGLSGYPYLALGDSLVWTGRLLDEVYVRYSLRVAGLSEDGLRVAGTAEMWIADRN